MHAKHAVTHPVYHIFSIEGNHQRLASNLLFVATEVPSDQGMLIAGSIFNSRVFYYADKGMSIEGGKASQDRAVDILTSDVNITLDNGTH